MQDFFDFLKVLLGLITLAACVFFGLEAAGVFGAAGGAMLWWLLAALSES